LLVLTTHEGDVMAELEEIYKLTKLAIMQDGARRVLVLVPGDCVPRNLIDLFQSSTYSIDTRNLAIAFSESKAIVRSCTNTVGGWVYGQYSDIVMPNNTCPTVKRIALSRWRSCDVEDLNLFMY
jgi:hypothetical protein